MPKHVKMRRYAALGLGAVALAGITIASAARLDVAAADAPLAGVSEFAPCDTDQSVNVDYTTDTAVPSDPRVTEIHVSGIDGKCDGRDLTVQVLDEDGADVITLTGVAAPGTVDFDGLALRAEDVATVAVVIS